MSRNLQAEWAALLFKTFADAGVRDVVISPGSRSTPLVVAAVREPRLTRHEVIDERAAGYFALGQARVTGRPSVVVCTSGTAAAQYLPAMIEANLTGTPIIVLTADRPHELYDCRSPQTIDQVKLFGENARLFFDLVPEANDGAFRALRRIVAQSVLTTTWPRPGAVHLNARARKPLEPVPPEREDEHYLAERARAIAGEPAVFCPAPSAAPAPEAILQAAALASAAERGIIVAGPAALAQKGAREDVWALAAATGFPVAAEATSQLRFAKRPPGVRFLDGFDLMLRSATFRERLAFDLAIQIGAPPTSGPWEQIAPSIPRVVLAEHGWNDPHGSARVMVFGSVSLSCRALAEAVDGAPAAHHLTFLDRAQASAWTAAEREIAATDTLSEAAVVGCLLERTPEGSILVLGNSLAVRLVDIYGRGGTGRDVDVLSQRGASGIDGLVAGAVGAASTSGRPTALLIGDVSMLYDLTSLSLAARLRTPFVVLVLHNGGGRIFEQLPICDLPGIEPSVIDHATTPHDTSFAPAAAMYGVPYARTTDVAEVSSALSQAYEHDGCTLIEARVERSGAVALARRVARAVEAAVRTVQTE
jgi:2-succinyl-5-enolpyruvyl-6-hydroxy-3-cyclohexene-1-carboxylate synthase